MSFSGLYIGTSGLAANQRALETAANNVANANTRGYSRQRVEASSAAPLLEHRGLLGPGATGQGVTIDGVTRAHDALVSSNQRETSAQLASWDSRAAFYGRAEQILGPLGAGTPQALTNFWNSWEALSQSPDSSTARHQVIDAAHQLTDSLNNAATMVENLANDLTSSLRAQVDETNVLARRVAELNGKIKTASVGDAIPNDLLDARDTALADLARLTGGQVRRDSDGEARVLLANIPLVDGIRAEPLVVSSGPPPTVTWKGDGRPVGAGGALGSTLELATSEIAAVTGQLDEIAEAIATVVNTAHNAGFGLDGVDGRPLFANTTAALIRVDPGVRQETLAASASGAANDGNHALVMGGLRNQLAVGDKTVDSLVNGLQGKLGLEAAHAARQREISALVVADANAARASVAGVSVDEELTDMLRFQRAYEASARVITVMDELMDKLINGTGSTR